jgi:general secretion pathway protein G
MLHWLAGRVMLNHGFLILELLFALAISGLLAAIAGPLSASIADRARIGEIADIGMLDMRLERFFSNNFVYPDSLDELPGDLPLDPWGRPYSFQRIRGNDTPGLRALLRKDRNLVPINSDYDLYSPGVDGDTRPPLSAWPSRDDIVRAADGSFVGSAIEF